MRTYKNIGGSLAYSLMGCVLLLSAVPNSAAESRVLQLEGIVVTPHVMAPRMRYTRAPKDDLAARVDLVIRNSSSKPVKIESVKFNGQTPESLRKTGTWAWHNLKAVVPDSIPPGGRTVWSYNARSKDWGVGSNLEMTMASDAGDVVLATPIESPAAWLSAVTFLGSGNSVYPDRIVSHVANSSTAALKTSALRLWVPSDPARWAILDLEVALKQQTTLPEDGQIPAKERGIIQASCEPLPLSYGLVCVEGEDAEGKPVALWGRLRIKREAFDISGGWVNSETKVGPALTYEPFLKTLKRLHVNTGHIAATPGYTNNSTLYEKYPLKYFNRLQPFAEYDTDGVLPRIHAAEFLGEPQYPNPEDVDSPQRVFDELLPYASTRLPTSVTLSDESTWRYYAGLSDYPHYDAYRVVAPHVDAWARYDWDGKKIIWGSPLETIGDMCRSLRELSRPAPTAYWAQGPHHGWKGFDGRKRRSPTPDEIRLQAYHALANRITSLYWFNLSPKSLVAYRDTFEELTRIGREIRMLEDLYLEGDAHFYASQKSGDGKGWDLSTIVAPRATLLFALDLDYTANREDSFFEFLPPRAATFDFPLPTWQQGDVQVFRVDADGVHDASYEKTTRGVQVKDTLAKVGIYIATSDPKLRAEIAGRQMELLEQEASFNFDPATDDEDFAELEKMVK